MVGLVLFCEVRGDGRLILGLDHVNPSTKVESIMWRATSSRTGQHGSLPCGLVVAEGIVLVENVDLDLGECLFVASKLVQVVPSHCVHVRL